MEHQRVTQSVLLHDHDEKNRTFLVYCTMFLVGLTIFTYWFTRDSNQLLTGSVSGAGLPFIFRYYFKR